MITAAQRSMAAGLATELSNQRLTVMLVPAPAPKHGSHCIRCVAESNPEWYKELCAAHLSRRQRQHRKPDTAIRRQHVLTGLRAIAHGQRGRLADRLLSVIDQELARDHAAEFMKWAMA